MGYSVFVSYSTRDLPTADALVAWIRHAGAEPFVAEYSVAPSQPLAANILSAIKNCDLFLLLWSASAKNSDWVPQEIGVARGLGKRIMPVVLHSGITLPGFICDLKYLPLYRDPQAEVAWLHAHVAQQVEERKAGAMLTLGVAGLLLLACTGESQ